MSGGSTGIAGAAGTEIAAGSRVSAVTVLQDRAQVTRTATVPLPAGPVRVRLAGVAPVLVDASLTATADGATVHDVRVERRLVGAPDADPDTAALDARVAVAEDELHRCRLRREAAADAVTAAAAAARCTLADLVDDAVRSDGDPPAWRAARERLDAAERARRTALVEAEAATAQAAEALHDLRQRQSALADPATTVAADVVLDVSGDAGGDGPATLTVGYLVPSALWRPAHRARLGSDTVELTTDAVVWQRTGERWDDVALTCSTARPSLGDAPPPLATDVVVAEPSTGLVVTQREEEVQTTGLGSGPTLDEVPGVDDGGEVRVLRPAGPVTVASDGRPHRFPVAAATVPATASLVTVPELAEAVVLRTEQVHPGPAPLLAGPVELVREHGVAGRTSVRFVAPGERWALAWGPEPDLRVTREAHQVEDRSAVTGRRTTRHSVLVRLSNLGGRPREVEVTDRVPVSEVAEVGVEVDPRATAPAGSPDRDGMVRRTVSLPPHGRAELRLGYAVTRARAVTSG